jgi:hypothetical protein
MIRRAVLAVVLVMSMAACSDEPARVGPDNGAAASSSAPTVAPGPITLSIELEQTTVPAGAPVAGVLVFENTGPAVDVLHQGCQPKWTVRLVAAALPVDVAFNMDCLMLPLTIPAGRSELPFELATTYSGCTQGESGASGIPQCVDNRPPALPGGTYEARLFTYDDVQLGGPPPAPMTVTLTG